MIMRLGKLVYVCEMLSLSGKAASLNSKIVLESLKRKEKHFGGSLDTNLKEVVSCLINITTALVQLKGTSLE